MKQNSKRFTAWLLAAVLCFTLLTGCGTTTQDTKKAESITKIADLSGKQVASLTGSVFASALDKVVSDAKHLYLNDLPSQLEAVESGKAVAALLDEPVARLAVAQHNDLTILDEKLGEDSYGFAFQKDDPLEEKVNRIVTALSEYGTLDDMEEKWFGSDETVKVLPELTHKANYDGSAGLLRIGQNTDVVPMSYLDDSGKPTGFEIELIMRIAYELNMKTDISPMPIDSVLISLQSGKSDMVGGCMSITEERKKSVDFSTPHYVGGMVAVIRKDTSADTGGSEKITTLKELEDKKVGVMTGSMYASVLEEYVPGCEPVFFNNATDQVEALRIGKISGIIYDEPTCNDIISSTDGMQLLSEEMGTSDFGIIADLNNTAMMNKVNNKLAEMEKNGELKKLKELWFDTDESKKVLPEMELPATNGVLRVATNVISPPNSYMKDTQIVGYEVALCMYLAQSMGMGLEVTDMDFSAIIPSVTTGKSDFGIGQITITEERKKSVLFSEAIDGSPIRMIVQDISGSDAALSQTAGAGESWYKSLADSFEKTFITENRYKLIFQGLGTTLIISVLSALFGTALGFGICMMRRARSAWLNIPAKLFIRLIQGIPIVVILMILFYLVFTDPDASPIMVAVIGFSINFAAYVSEMMRTGMDAVDKGQIEAASALGFRKLQTFCKITLPQAARHVLPVYKGEFISMIKMTSVVGYIAIQDLTKMSDIIRSRTYEAFFPLIVTAAIYFIISYLLTVLLTMIEVKVDPKHRKRIVKGVNSQ